MSVYVLGVCECAGMCAGVHSCAWVCMGMWGYAWALVILFRQTEIVLKDSTAFVYVTKSEKSSH